jgi:hypothetical protein
MHRWGRLGSPSILDDIEAALAGSAALPTLLAATIVARSLRPARRIPGDCSGAA